MIKFRISVTDIGPEPMDTPFFYGQETTESTAYNKAGAALSSFSKTGLTDIEDIVPLVRFLVSEGWWIALDKPFLPMVVILHARHFKYHRLHRF
jgi:hypothetical protein